MTAARDDVHMMPFLQMLIMMFLLVMALQTQDVNELFAVRVG